MLRFGDVLLLKGPIGQQAALQDSDQFLVLEPVELEARRLKKAPLAILTMGGVLALTGLAGLPIATAMVMGAVAMVLLGCLSMDEAYQSIEWRSVFLIAGMLPLGLAMQSSGTALFLARQLVDLLGSFGPLAVLAGIYILAGLITQPMSNAAATVLMVPIAIDLAQGLGASPQAFALATVIGASTSFLTPVGHQANVLMFGPGNYRFWDYARAGAPLNLVILIATLIALPAIWPLFP
jgi:di/tricarboxylate transporter